MDDEQFEALVSELNLHLRAAAMDFMKANRLPFSGENFLRNKSVDLPQLSKELLFYGCDIFPESSNPQAE